MSRYPKCDGEIWAAIEDHWLTYYSPPSIQYLIENSCIASKNTVWLALRRLAKKKQIVLVKTDAGMKAYTTWAYYTLKRKAETVIEMRTKI